MILLIGVDGGGTKTECWIAERPAGAAGTQLTTPIGKGQSGPSNPAAIGVEAACGAIVESIKSAFEDAGVARRQAEACVIGLAGAGNESLRSRMEDWARKASLAQQVRVVSDIELVLWAGAQDGVGIAVISGTGSIAWGRNEHGKTARAGGWGYLIGDGGSGFAIGQAALAHTAQAFDADDDLGVLGNRIFRRLGIADAAELSRAVHTAPDPRATIASLAAEVFAAADDHDADAIVILDEAADDLAALIAAIERKLKCPRPTESIIAAGSVLVRNPRFVQSVQDGLARTFGLDIELHLAAHPVEGALRLAARALM